jgi:hypothetical protein
VDLSNCSTSQLVSLLADFWNADGRPWLWLFVNNVVVHVRFSFALILTILWLSSGPCLEIVCNCWGLFLHLGPLAREVCVNVAVMWIIFEISGLTSWNNWRPHYKDHCLFQEWSFIQSYQPNNTPCGDFRNFRNYTAKVKVCIIVRGLRCGVSQCVCLHGFRGMAVLSKGREFLTHPGNLYL